MNDLALLISHHGYALLAAICFAEAIGLPLPAALAILTAGAVAAYGQLHFYFVFVVGLVAMLAGDVLLYFAGRPADGRCWGCCAGFPQIQRPASCARRNTFIAAAS